MTDKVGFAGTGLMGRGMAKNILAAGYPLVVVAHRNRTPMVTEQLTSDQRQDLLRQIPVGRFCEPDEVAQLIAFLVSPHAGFITGEIIDINGGLHLD